MTKSNIRVFSTATILYAFSAGDSIANDSQLLMYASKLNIGRHLAKECNVADPRFSAEYEDHLTKIKANLKNKGLTEDVFKTAETIPELSSKGYIEKYKELPTERQLKWCIQAIIDIQQDASLAQSVNE